MNPRIGFRITTLVFAAFLGAQCSWLLVAELLRPGINHLPADATAAADASSHRGAAALAAEIGAIRGDLWAESAFTYADLLWTDADANGAGFARAVADARGNLSRALHDAPHESGAWLLLAGLALRYPAPGQNANDELKMSYYTGPSDKLLVPQRLSFAVRFDFVNDFEMRQFVTRDLRLLLARQEKTAIVAAYNAASPTGKSFIVHAVGEIDPSASELLRRADSPKTQLPN
jgi:hypothetical protein